MARIHEEREDLLTEMTALVERAELSLGGGEAQSPGRDVPHSQVLVAGFRRSGGLSFYFGSDPVYQFNADGQVRRIFASDALYAAQRGKLVAIERRSTSGRIQLAKTALSADAQAVLLAEMHRRLGDVERSLREGRYQILRAVPESADVPARILDWLNRHAGRFPVAQRAGES